MSKYERLPQAEELNLPIGTLVMVEGYSDDWDGVGRVDKHGIKFLNREYNKYGYFFGTPLTKVRPLTEAELLEWKLTCC